MISILIPTYNYNVTTLVKSIHSQCCENNIDFEIICFEDGSTQKYVTANSEIKQLSHTSLYSSDDNLGRVKARQFLCDKAQYDWLLFLDADVLPKHENFIKNYIALLKPPYDVVYGGFTYDKAPPSNTYMLRWKYGIRHEEVPAYIRNKKPYKVIISANFIIRKDLFKSIISSIDYNIYGLDSYIGAKLKELKINTYHIDNEVLHLGIEKSSVFLKKKEQASDVLIQLNKEHNVINTDNSLLNLFLKLKKFKLNYFFALIFKTFKTAIKKNLLSKNPSIKLLQLYRISYMCYKDLNPDKQ